MKNILKIIISLLLFMPFTNVKAISCYNKEIDTNKINSFSCSKIESDTLTFKDSTTEQDYSKYFNYIIDTETKEAQTKI